VYKASSSSFPPSSNLNLCSRRTRNYNHPADGCCARAIKTCSFFQIKCERVNEFAVSSYENTSPGKSHALQGRDLKLFDTRVEEYFKKIPTGTKSVKETRLYSGAISTRVSQVPMLDLYKTPHSSRTTPSTLTFVPRCRNATTQRPMTAAALLQ
jgi:hypothetical protein